MYRALYFLTLYLCQLSFAFARAVPGVYLSGRNHAERDATQKLKERTALWGEERKIAPKVIIISMVKA